MNESHPVNPAKTDVEIASQIHRISSAIIARANELPWVVRDLGVGSGYIDELQVEVRPEPEPKNKLTHLDAQYMLLPEKVGTSVEVNDAGFTRLTARQVDTDEYVVVSGRRGPTFKPISGISRVNLRSRRLDESEIVSSAAGILAKARGEVAKRESISQTSFNPDNRDAMQRV